MSTAVTNAVERDAANVYGKTREERTAYRERAREIRDAFAADLAEEFLPLSSKTVTDAAFEWAWGEGHSEGYHRVADIYEDLADFVAKVEDSVRER